MSILRKNILHLVLWLFGGPWLGSTLWFIISGFRSAGGFSVEALIGMIPFAAFFGFIGMILCLVITIPAYLVTMLIFNYASRLQKRRWFYSGFIVFGGAFGVAISAYGNRLLNTGRIEYVLILIGVVGGVMISLVTFHIWQQQMNLRANHRPRGVNEN